MKLIFTLLLACCSVTVFGQYNFTGLLKSAETGMPVPDASVRSQLTSAVTVAGADGFFSFTLKSKTDTLLIHATGYEPKLLAIYLPLDHKLDIMLQPKLKQLQEVVVSTGYYAIPKERATGSFTHINEELLERSVSTDLLSRLEGITNGLQFERTGTFGENGETPKLRIRGLSTLYSDTSPLIVINNFPYEGDINDINPNDVESVTLLKDAAAASIWGARAANGVIIITTKSGRFNQPLRINFNSNINIKERPNLNYRRDYLPAADWMQLEAYLFDRGQYAEENATPIPPYVELLIKHRDGLLSTAALEQQSALLRQQDIRKDARSYLYQNSINQQYALNLNGGTPDHHYYLSAGYDHNTANLIGNDYRRLSLSANQTLKLKSKLELTTGLYYNHTLNHDNGISLSELKPATLGLIPYTSLADEQGNALPILKDRRMLYEENAQSLGLLDWSYRPLEEQRLANRSRQEQRVRLDAGLKYSIISGLDMVWKYQYQNYHSQAKAIYHPNSYEVRNLVNRFTQTDGTQVIPLGGIYNGSMATQQAHYGRLQLNYQKTFNRANHLVLLAGSEINQDRQSSPPAQRIYNYQEEVLTGSTTFDYTRNYPTLPEGNGRIPAIPNGFEELTDRNLSYFTNASFSMQDKYILSGSSRWDGSNIFGVKTNQKGVPLWSVGASWEISKEAFWQLQQWSYLRLRTTFGYNGNINRNASALPTIQNAYNDITGLRFAILTSAGNPSLRWEKVQTLNLGMDFGIFENRLRGSLEYYQKNARDLIGTILTDPTLGLSQILFNQVNYAHMETRGLDLELETINSKGKLTWSTSYLWSITKNKVSRYLSDESLQGYAYNLSSMPNPEVGQSRDALYALPWAGLSPENGMPQVVYNGETGTAYTPYLNNLAVKDLLVAGVSVAPYYGSIRNTFSYKKVMLSANVSWKAAYVFRRSSVNYRNMFNSGVAHADYLQRWQQPGDELNTQVPALPADVNTNRDYVYTYSAALVEKGDHIRLQDIQLSYLLDKSTRMHLPFRNIRFSIYANNLGFIWRANKQGLDPDYPNAAYPASRSLAIGLKAFY